MAVNKTLFDIHYEWLNIITEVEENEGELTDDLIERLNINKDELLEKVDGYSKVIKSYNSDIELLKDSIERLNLKISSKTKTIERLKEFLKIGINMYGEPGGTIKKPSSGKKVKTDLFTVYTVFNKPLIIEEEKLNINELIEVSTTQLKNKFNREQLLKLKEFLNTLDLETEELLILDKTAIKKSIENGEEYTGISLDENANFVTIK